MSLESSDQLLPRSVLKDFGSFALHPNQAIDHYTTVTQVEMALHGYRFRKACADDSISS